MQSAIARRGLASKTATLMVAWAAVLACDASAASFVGSAVPIRVRTAMCDGSPRVLVDFADSSKNIWYPANAGDGSKYFLTTALTAKTADQPMYFLGTDDTVTSYCVAGGYRLATVFGIE